MSRTRYAIFFTGVALQLLLLGLFFTRQQSSSAGPDAGGPVIRVADVSPDATYGDSGKYGEFGADTGGRIFSVVADPSSTSFVYAATEFAGVWRSIDGAHSWTNLTTGLGSGATQHSERALAVDETNGNRLLYATGNDDLRVNTPLGGLWYSVNAGSTWNHVDLPMCFGPSIGNVAFAAGRGYVATRCGVFTAAATNLASWALHSPTTGKVSRVTASGQNVYACDGNSLWRSTDGGATWPTTIAVPNNYCNNIVVAPDDPDDVILSYTEVISSDLSYLHVKTHEFDNGNETQLSDLTNQCCGNQGAIAAVRLPGTAAGLGPGRSYDLFVSDGFRFNQLNASTNSWEAISSPHVDTWAMTFSPIYDPSVGRCYAYMANDGGIWANIHDTSTACRTRTSYDWKRAMVGLHAFNNFNIAAVSQPACGQPLHPCPAIWLPSAHNGTWGTLTGGTTNTSAWHQMGCCGDNGASFVDPMMPTLTLTTRNGIYQLYKSTDSRPPVGDVNAQDLGNIAPPYARIGIAPPQLAALSQIMTMPSGDTFEPNGDFVAVRSPYGDAPYPLVAGDDIVLRNRRGIAGGWVDFAPHFTPGKVGLVATSGGHTNPTVFVLTHNFDPQTLARVPDGGKVYKGRVGSNGRISSWVDISAGLGHAFTLFANPYNPNVLYVMDIPDSGPPSIKSTDTGGQSWTVDTELTRMATNDGEFRFDCGAPARLPRTDEQTDYWCAFSQIIFPLTFPNIRVAVLNPAGLAFSRDDGRHWIPLIGATGRIDRPYSAFYDSRVNPQTNTPSLYVALAGHGARRIDAPFNTMEAVTYQARGLPANALVSALNISTGVRTTLKRDAIGVYRGIELFDSAGMGGSFSYRYDVTPQGSGIVYSTLPIVHQFTSGEFGSGVITADDQVGGRSLSLTRPPAAYPLATQTWASAFTSGFGGASMVARLSFTSADAQHLFIGAISYEVATGNICLQSSALLSSCSLHSSGGTLQNNYMTVDVARTTASPSGTQLSVTWVFSFKDAATNRIYNVTPGGTDRAGLPVAGSSYQVGVTHQPAVVGLESRPGYAAPGKDAAFTGGFRDPDGNTDLSIVSLAFVGTGGPTLSYSRSQNRLLVSDQPPAPTPGCIPGPNSTSQFITTPSLILNCRTSSVVLSGTTTLSVTWHISFTSALAGRRFDQKLKATDLEAGDSGLVTAGSVAVGNPPGLFSAAPTSGSQFPSFSQVFTGTYYDLDGLPNLHRLELQLDTGFILKCNLGGCSLTHKSIELYYYLDGGLYGAGDNNGPLDGTCQSPGTGQVPTALGYLNCFGSSARAVNIIVNGQSLQALQIAWKFTANTAASGSSYRTYLIADDDAAIVSGPTQFGTWNINSTPNPGVNSPAAGFSPPGTVQRFVTTCSDADGWRDIHTIDFKLVAPAPAGEAAKTVTPTLHLQFDQDQGLMRLYNPDTAIWSEGHPGDNAVLSNRFAELRLASSSVHGHGPTDPVVDITWDVVFKDPAAASATYEQFLRIEDDSASSTSEDFVGTWRVGGTGCIFSDVCPGEYFYAPVQYLVGQGAISGYADGTFRPYNNTTRGQLAKIVVLANGLALDVTGGPHFHDVPPDHPFYQYVETSYHHQLIAGYADGSFRPYNNVTRGQVCKIVVLSRGWTLIDPAQPTFVDVARDNPFYKEIETAVAHQIISGYDLPNGQREFRWGNSATRGQIAKIVFSAVTAAP